MQLLPRSRSPQMDIHTAEDRSVNSCGLSGSTLVRRNVASEKVRTVIVVLRREGGSAAWISAAKKGSFSSPPARRNAHNITSN